MRVFCAATTVLVGFAFVAYTSPGTSASAQAQATQASITSGEKLTLFFDPVGTGRPCTVIDVRGDFVGCKGDVQNIARPGADRWYNLELIARIDRPATQE
jgi:hypothetical protein